MGPKTASVWGLEGCLAGQQTTLKSECPECHEIKVTKAGRYSSSRMLPNHLYALLNVKSSLPCPDVYSAVFTICTASSRWGLAYVGGSSWVRFWTRERQAMRRLVVTSAVLAALCLPALADPGNGNENGRDNPNNPHYRGAPGPIAGAGLPIIAVGCGAYWLVRRYRRKSHTPPVCKLSWALPTACYLIAKFSNF